MSYMRTTTHTIVVKLSHEVVVSLVRWLFREATTSFFSKHSLLHIIQNFKWPCMGQHMELPNK
jgi:hypothetical protein